MGRRAGAMVEVDASASLDSFRRFVMASTCESFAPQSYLDDSEIFPERSEEPGVIYVEAADKVTLKEMRGITFVNARDVLGVIYNSKSGNTSLKWRQQGKFSGKVTGTASDHTIVNMAQAGVVGLKWVEDYAEQKRSGDAGAQAPG